MSLNPSNGIAARDNPGKTMFPNLARKLSDSMTEEHRQRVYAEVDAATAGELKQAGIKVDAYEPFRTDHTEVPTKNIGTHCSWAFRRAWYYWVASGPGVPPDKAEEFHKTWGTQVRVDGHCGCPSPSEWFRGFAAGLYHIDTQEGLNAFAELLRAIYIPTKEEVEAACISA